MENKLTPAIENDLHNLIGQCLKSIDSVLEDHGEDMNSITMEDAYRIDTIVFCCNQCGWYAGADDIHDFHCEWVCGNCYFPEDDEDQDED